MGHTGPGISMVKQFVFVAVLLLICACSSSTITPTTAPSPSAIIPTENSSAFADKTAPFRQFVESVNNGDVNGALTVLTDDVVWERGGQCPPGACVGKQAVQREIARDVANHHVMTIVGSDAEENNQKVRIELQTDGTRRANVERIVQIFYVELKSNKIAAVRVAVDTSDPATAAFQAAQGRQGQ